MRCGTPCFLCGEVVELSEMSFFTGICDCSPFGSCAHGVCVACRHDGLMQNTVDREPLNRSRTDQPMSGQELSRLPSIKRGD